MRNSIVQNHIRIYNRYIDVMISLPKYAYRKREKIKFVGKDESKVNSLREMIKSYKFHAPSALTSLSYLEKAEYNKKHKGWKFAEYVEYNLSYVCGKDDRVFCVDEHNEPDWFCSKSSETFLLAFDEVLKLKTERMLADNDLEPQALETLDRCTEISGGQDYREFYCYVLGVGLE